MINYNWKISQLLTQTIDGKQDYVVIAGYEVEAQEEEYKASTGFYAVQFSTETIVDFIPYTNLTEEIIIEWVKEVLGESGVSSIEESLSAQIESQKNPPQVPVIAPLPWTSIN